MTERNLVVLVDEQDNYLGTKDKLSAHQEGLLHRAFSVMLYRFNKNNNIEFLLQQRAKDKYHCGGLWTNTCCSHPQKDEDILSSAKSRLKEELLDINSNLLNLVNIDNFIYRAEFNNGLTEHEYDYVILSEYSETPSYFNTDEVCNIEWMSIKDIEHKYSQNKSNFTPWFYQVYNTCLEYIHPPR